ncbi:acetylgalactosamine 3-beta-galactosyltransferase 1 [Seminavis robusta]|uniref:Acetylgalactosamine 3-beta-galactosyltransferase 1 n=1 Tax=Seminavis robusta TaxID=568900 RepID=A0A9N8EIH7_9STRA|nr:acetylgalactosamine 3-beta-galactosyltransferase 1 [Seminavis robusta]|eukprot:Sro1252_g256270.1 acetylgalactosamine 3-beta-galactosyltransferase 1 (333) ;mRNA; f:16040-17038
MSKEDSSKRPQFKKWNGTVLLVFQGLVIVAATSRFSRLFNSRVLMPELVRFQPAREFSEEKRSLLCFVMLAHDQYGVRAHQVMDAWGPRCDKLLFVGAKEEENATSIPHVKLLEKEEDTPGELSRKAHRAWKHIYDNHVDDYDFFMKADLDTYMLMDNYFSFIKRLDPSIPHYFGRQFKELRNPARTFVAGASVTLSRAALQRLGRAFNNDNKQSNKCSTASWKEHGHGDDVALAHCLATLGIYSLDTRDELGRERFMVFNVDFMKSDVNLPSEDWYTRMAFNSKIGPGCCSDKAICFHYVDSSKLSVPLVFNNGVWDWDHNASSATAIAIH